MKNLLLLYMLMLTGCDIPAIAGFPYDKCYDYKAMNYYNPEGGPNYYDDVIDEYPYSNTSDCWYCEDEFSYLEWETYTYEEQYQQYLYGHCCNLEDAINFNEDVNQYSDSLDSTHCVFE